MSAVPITVFLYEDLDRDFVWAVRKPEFASEARPGADQIQPVLITSQTFAMVVINDAGQKVKTYPMTVVTPSEGRINITVQSGVDGAEWKMLMRKSPLFYRVICIDGASDRALFGGPFTIETK